MPNENPSEHKGNVSVFIYKLELDFLKWLVLQKCDIETGGDLFGLWQDENTAVVQLILGPRAKSKRTTTSFHQDVDYPADTGGGGGVTPSVNIFWPRIVRQYKKCRIIYRFV